jgi:hypothetical protein
MTNLQVILLKLFEPVMDTSFSKVLCEPAEGSADCRSIRSILDTFKTRDVLILRKRPKSKRQKKRPMPITELGIWRVCNSYEQAND